MKAWVLMALALGLLAGCQQTAASNDESIGMLGESISEKTPHKPTTFVDTTGSRYAWDRMYNPVQALQSRIAPPSGFQRMPAEAGSFAEWLRGIPLKPGKPQVMLHNGQPKAYQGAQFAVLNIDVGTRDLQQCADAVMRLRAEYLYAQHRFADIHFNFTSGAPCPWDKWRAGQRPVISGSKVTWTQKAAASDSHTNFRSYMDMVFMYAGTASLEKELTPIGKLSDLQIGDVLIQGGFPGHAVLVMDVVEHPETHARRYLLAQSYMPAQEIHILRNPAAQSDDPWYDTAAADPIETPEWTFAARNLRRFR